MQATGRFHQWVSLGQGGGRPCGVAARVYSRVPRPGRSFSEGQQWVLYALETEGAVYGFLVDNVGYYPVLAVGYFRFRTILREICYQRKEGSMVPEKDVKCFSF